MDAIEPARLHIPPSDEWDAAYQRVENYLHALQIRNRPVLNRLVQRILENTLRKIEGGDQRAPVEVAGEEMMHALDRWFRGVTTADEDKSEGAMLVRGRMALLMSQLSPERQALVLAEPIEDDAFLEEMRRAYNLAGPDFEQTTMQARPLDYGAGARVASSALTKLDRKPRLRLVIVWTVLIALFALIFYYTR